MVKFRFNWGISNGIFFRIILTKVSEVRRPCGVATPEQWLVLDELAHKYGNGTLKLSTRQAFQLHGVLKWNMKKTLQ